MIYSTVSSITNGLNVREIVVPPSNWQLDIEAQQPGLIQQCSGCGAWTCDVRCEWCGRLQFVLNDIEGTPA